MSSSVLNSSVLKVSQLLQSGKLTASELCELCLERLQNIKGLNAFITVTADLARQQAAAADDRISRGKSLGLLDGVPVAFKDNFNTLGVRTTCGSNMLRNYCSPYNATVVQRLLDQGAVIIGKTNLDEFGMGSGTVDSIFGPSRNPWRSGLRYKFLKRSKFKKAHSSAVNKCDDPVDSKPLVDDWFVTGGSSGGSAVAVATSTCFGALGSDTGGSTRSPASLCGVVGLKPTYGLVSRHGLIPLTNSLDVPGILAKSVDDAALLLCSLAGHDPKDSTTITQPFNSFILPDEVNVKGLHIGIPKEYQCPGMSQEVIDTWERVSKALENSGAKVTSVSLPHTKYSIVCYSVLCCCEVASNFARYDGIEFGHRASEETSTENLYAATRHEGFGEVVRGRILAGNYFLLKKNYDKYFIQATKVRRLIYEDFKKVYESGVDLLLTPVTLTDAVPYSVWLQKDNREHNATDDYCTQPVNMAGLPAVSIPCSLSKQGLPLSLQLIGKPFKEEIMLTAAKWIEQQMNFPMLDVQC